MKEETKDNTRKGHRRKKQRITLEKVIEASKIELYTRRVLKEKTKDIRKGYRRK